MGGEGSIQPLLNNNRNLLRKKRLFNKNKSISDRKNELLKNHTGKLKFKKTSQKELLIIKKKIQTTAKRQNLKSGIYLSFALLLVVGIMILHLYRTSKLEKELEANIAPHILTENPNKILKKYNAYIEDGEDQFEKQHWKNAIYFYKKALLMKPKDSLASTKLKISKDLFKALTPQ